MDWIPLGGEGPRPPPPRTPLHPAIYKGPPPLKLPMDRISPHHGLYCAAFSQGRFFLFLHVLAPTKSFFVVSGSVFLENIKIWSDFVIFHQFGIIGLDLDLSYFPSFQANMSATFYVLMGCLFVVDLPFFVSVDIFMQRAFSQPSLCCARFGGARCSRNAARFSNCATWAAVL